MRPYSILFKKPTGTTIDTQDVWGIVCKDFPFKLYGDVKELPSQNWFDEHGNEEYIPNHLYINSYDITAEFAFKGTRESANAPIRGFLNYLSGNDGLNQGAELSVYDTYTKIGRQKVRYISVSDELIIARDDSNGDVFTFKVKFRVNDPITDITL